MKGFYFSLTGIGLMRLEIRLFRCTSGDDGLEVSHCSRISSLRGMTILAKYGLPGGDG